MKVAFLFLKGIDGCGVTRFASEHQKYVRAKGHTCDIFSYNRKYGRTAAHELEVSYFKKDEYDGVCKQLNDNYDIVIINSYPNGKDFNPVELNDVYNSTKKIEKPILVGMMHEIKAITYNRIPSLLMFLSLVDQVITFSMDVDFVSKLKEFAPNIYDKTCGYTIPLNKSEAEQMYASSLVIPFEEKNKAAVYFGRWTTMKDPHRLLDMQEICNATDKYDLMFLLIGLERSIGCKFDIIDHPLSEVRIAGNIDYQIDYETLVDDTKAYVYGPIKRANAFNELYRNMFGCSFYKLKEKEKNNYGNRMEYTQMELSCVSVPVFDKHWGTNNYNYENEPFINVDHSAVYVDATNLEEGLDTLTEISNDKTLYMKYRESAFNNILDNYNSDKVIPEFYRDIAVKGKCRNIKTGSDFIDSLLIKEELKDFYVNELTGEPIISLQLNTLKKPHRFEEEKTKIQLIK